MTKMDIPKQLRKVPEVHLGYDFRGLTEPTSWIYFLCRQGKVVYVGKTTIGIRRIFQHFVFTGTKKRAPFFDSFWYIEVPPRDLNLAEGYFIVALTPEGNSISKTTQAFYHRAIARRK